MLTRILELEGIVNISPFISFRVRLVNAPSLCTMPARDWSRRLVENPNVRSLSRKASRTHAPAGSSRSLPFLRNLVPVCCCDARNMYTRCLVRLDLVTSNASINGVMCSSLPFVLLSMDPDLGVCNGSLTPALFCACCHCISPHALRYAAVE